MFITPLSGQVINEVLVRKKLEDRVWFDNMYVIRNVGNVCK